MAASARAKKKKLIHFKIRVVQFHQIPIGRLRHHVLDGAGQIFGSTYSSSNTMVSQTFELPPQHAMMKFHTQKLPKNKANDLW
jgi:hypothetical protein